MRNEFGADLRPLLVADTCAQLGEPDGMAMCNSEAMGWAENSVLDLLGLHLISTPD